MRLDKKPETIQAARKRLQKEIAQSQSTEALIKHTVEVLKLLTAYPPENPEFYRKLQELENQRQKPMTDKKFLDSVMDN